jgi:hypothetical protein
MGPHLLLTEQSRNGLRSLADVKRSVMSGHGQKLWTSLKLRADRSASGAPLVPTDMIPGRDPLMAKHGNADYVIVQAAADRIMDAALVALITDDLSYKDAALVQIEALYDASHWPEWRDLAHHFVAADLRTGQLCQAVGFAFDWLYPMLSEHEREWIVDGIDRCGIRPYMQAYDENASYFARQNNWQTCVVGGLGIAGMALEHHHPDAQQLMDMAHKRMLAYRSVYGPAGEFNENPGYAGATRLPVIYFSAHRYHTGGGENLLAEAPFPETCKWYMYFTAPPDRVVDFGDTHANAPPGSSHYAAVAAATGSSMLQWYYLNYQNREDSSLLPLELLWYDDTIKPESPEGSLPLGDAFPAHGGCISSRSDWHERRPHTVVFSKAGHGSEAHGHHDAGQVCVDAHGERMIVDLCSPPMYPEDFFEENRYRYYNAGVLGHNVLMFDGQETFAGEMHRAEIEHAQFDEHVGGGWRLDLSGCYEGLVRYKRAVAHLLPGIVAVLDEAELTGSRDISLRWHTVDQSEPDREGRFVVQSGTTALSARIVGLDGIGLTYQRRRHAYHEPYNKGRLGDIFEDRHESYVEVQCQSDRCRLLTLFYVPAAGDPPCDWEALEDGWSPVGETSQGIVKVGAQSLSVWAATPGRSVRVGLD